MASTNTSNEEASFSCSTNSARKKVINCLINTKVNVIPLILAEKSKPKKVFTEESSSSSSDENKQSSEKRNLSTKERLAIKKKLKSERKQQRQLQEESEEKSLTSRPESDIKLRTATDVIKRIKWDPSLNLDNFSVGYLDRFLGVIEEPFETFNWEDEYTSLDPDDDDELAVPKHRIQYFKYKGKVVWDKKIRLDNIFGSCGGKKFEEMIAEELKERS